MGWTYTANAANVAMFVPPATSMVLELTSHAEAIGADAVASLPPFVGGGSSLVRTPLLTYVYSCVCTQKRDMPRSVRV